MRLKFEDCISCRFRRAKHVCRDCDMGELYEDEETPGVDAAFREIPTRFGESVSADEQTELNVNLDRLAESIEEPEEDEDDEA